MDGVSLAPLILGKAGEPQREWIMALGHGPAEVDEKGIRGVNDFATRVIRDKRFKVWVNTEKKIDQLYDLVEDPSEETNLLTIGVLSAGQQAARREFQAVVDSLPDQDARPLYEPRAANPWDKKAAAAGGGKAK